MSEYKLTQEIISRSVAANWDLAKLEWKLIEVYKETDPLFCLCGHSPINEICVLLNFKNKKEVIVGNCCVNKFIGLESDKIFQAVNRIVKNINSALNIETLNHAYKKRWINDWEKNFYVDIMRKKKMTEKQKSKKVEINRLVLSKIARK